MKKRIFAILMAVVMVMTLVVGAILAMAADDGTITVRIHYHRPAGDYEGWELWAWDLDGKSDVSGTSAKDGSAVTAPPYKFEEGTDEVVATITVPTGTMRVGYIARFGEWEAKDIDYDQHINLTGILSGTVDFYIESGVPSQWRPCAPPAAPTVPPRSSWFWAAMSFRALSLCPLTTSPPTPMAIPKSLFSCPPPPSTT